MIASRAPSSIISPTPVRRSSSSENSWPTSPSASSSFGVTTSGPLRVAMLIGSPSESSTVITPSRFISSISRP